MFAVWARRNSSKKSNEILHHKKITFHQVQLIWEIHTVSPVRGHAVAAHDTKIRFRLAPRQTQTEGTIVIMNG